MQNNTIRRKLITWWPVSIPVVLIPVAYGFAGLQSGSGISFGCRGHGYDKVVTRQARQALFYLATRDYNDSGSISNVWLGVDAPARYFSDA
jgi:hypothetical protein